MARQEASPLKGPLFKGTAAVLGVVGGAVATRAEAQVVPAPAAASAPDNAVVLPELNVQGSGVVNTNAAPLGIARLPATVRETPQIVNVVPREIIEQQKITTLEQALRNVPGITLSTGEGQGGQQGDQFRIRGLAAKGDIYLDGLRDFGAYVRDAFNTESVEVIKGPGGQFFGVGNVGGIINQSSKRAHLGDSLHLEQGFGTDGYHRSTFDANYQLGETTALRLNGVWHGQETAERDHSNAARQGLAADFGMGLGTDTTWRLGYQYLHVHRKPDYGVPMIAGRDGVFRPITEFGLDRSTAYTRSFDHDISDTHNLTSSFRHVLNPFLTISNDTRFTFYQRDYASTAPAACTGACATGFWNGGNPTISYGAGGGMGYRQEGWAVQNVTNLAFEGETGGLRHRGNLGLDVSYQRDRRFFGSWQNRVNNQTLEDPAYYNSNVYMTYPGTGHRVSTATDVGLYVSDRVWFNEQWSVNGALRWDAFDATYWSGVTAGAAEQGQTNYRTSPSASLIYEPTRDLMFYASFARSYKPVGTDVSTLSSLSGTNELVSNANNLRPERSDIYEVGTKVDLLDRRLGLTAAVFQVNKSDSFTYDDTGAVVVGFSDAGEGRRIRGTELTATGRLTSNWDVNVAYAYLRGEVTASSTRAYIGNEAPQVPHHNVSLWTTYDVTSMLPGLPGNLRLGGGMQYASNYWTQSSHAGRIPETLAFDGMVSYKQDRYTVSLNGYNLGNHLNYQSAFNATRAVPAAGRTFILSVGVDF